MEKNDLALLPKTYNPLYPLPDGNFEQFLDFSDKQSYFEWRAYWRDEYKQLSGTIRALRKVWRSQGSNIDPMTNSELKNARARARSMLHLRRLSKAKAQRLYQESKAAAEVA